MFIGVPREPEVTRDPVRGRSGRLGFSPNVRTAAAPGIPSRLAAVSLVKIMFQVLGAPRRGG
jgi:hypothetical protein